MNDDSIAQLIRATIRKRLQSEPACIQALLAEAEAQAWQEVTTLLAATMRDAILAEVASAVSADSKAAPLAETPATASGDIQRLADTGVAFRGDTCAGAPKRAGATQTPCEHVAEPGVDGETGIYVYGIIDRSELVLEGIAGVAGGIPIRSHRCGPLAAVISDVPLSEFGQEALEAHLSDMSWLERNVRAHQAVLDAVLPLTTLIPMKFGTVFYSIDSLDMLLTEQARGLAHVLEQLAGKREWGLKLYVDPAILVDHIATYSERMAELQAQITGKSQGVAYFMARKLQEEAEAETERVSFSIADEIHVSLAGHSVGACLNPLGPDQNEERRLLLSAAYLVAETDEPAFQGQIAALSAAHAGAGFTLVLSGPWPAYNFVASLESAEPTHDA